LAAWLRAELTELRIETSQPYQEDWGWELPAKLSSGSYFLCISGNSDESSANTDQGEWRIIVERKRSLGQVLTGKGKISLDDEMMRTLEGILTKEPAVLEVHREQ